MALFNSDPSLVVIAAAGLTRKIPVPFNGIVLGRDARLGPPFSTDEFVSRSHVWVRRQGDGVEVTDLGSANGTYVNGIRVRAPTRMQDSDMLRIGRIQLKLAAPGTMDQAMAAGDRPGRRAKTVPQSRNLTSSARNSPAGQRR